MSDFMPQPKVTLKDANELLSFLENPTVDFSDDYRSSDKWEVKSNFLCNCIREIESNEKYPYNSDVWTLAREKLGLEKIEYYFWDAENKTYYHPGDILDTLVYNAQKYKHSDDLVAAGYASLSQEMANEAFQKNAKIETPNGKIFNVKKINDKVYVMPKYSKNQALCLGFQPAKIVFNNK
jgi:hypothetical protein